MNILIANSNSAKTLSCAGFTRVHWKSYLSRCSLLGSFSPTMFPGTNNVCMALANLLAIASHCSNTSPELKTNYSVKTKEVIKSNLAKVLLDMSDSDLRTEISNIVLPGKGVSAASSSTDVGDVLDALTGGSSIQVNSVTASTSTATNDKDNAFYYPKGDAYMILNSLPSSGFIGLLDDNGFISRQELNARKPSYLLCYFNDFESVSLDSIISEVANCVIEDLKNEEFSAFRIFELFRTVYLSVGSAFVAQSAKLAQYHARGYDEDKLLCHDSVGEGGALPVSYCVTEKGVLSKSSMVIKTPSGFDDTRIPPVTVPFTMAPGFIDSLTPFVPVIMATFLGTTLKGGRATQIGTFLNMKNASEKVMIYAPESLNDDPVVPTGRDIGRDTSGILKFLRSNGDETKASKMIPVDIVRAWSEHQKETDYGFNLPMKAIYRTVRFRSDRTTFKLLASNEIVIGRKHYALNSENESIGQLKNCTPIAFLIHPISDGKTKDGNLRAVAKNLSIPLSYSPNNATDLVDFSGSVGGIESAANRERGLDRETVAMIADDLFSDSKVEEGR